MKSEADENFIIICLNCIQAGEKPQVTYDYQVFPQGIRIKYRCFNCNMEELEAAPIKGRDAGQDARNVPHKKRTTPNQNNHPTCKTIKLMKYLINLNRMNARMMMRLLNLGRLYQKDTVKINENSC